MHKARAFFFVCAGLLCLAAAYHLGATSAGAQAGGTIVGFGSTSASHCSGTFFMATSNGDVYGRVMTVAPCVGSTGPLEYLGNFWSGATPAAQPTWGQLKARYATPAPGKVTR